MPRLGLAISPPMPHSDLVSIAQEAERRGLDSFWLTMGAGKNPLVQLAALASQTRRIALGTSIVNIYSGSAAHLAMSAAALDDISEGRFILGLGTGHKSAVELFHGVPFQKPLQRMRAYVTIIRQALAGQPVTHQGSTHTVRDLRLQFLPPSGKVPLYISILSGLRLARLAGEMADGVILNLPTLEHLARVRRAIAEGAKAAGRNPADIDVACFILCQASRDREQGRLASVKAVASYYGSMHFYRELFRHTGFQEEADALEAAWERRDADGAMRCVSERLLQALPIASTAQAIPDKVQAFRKAGVDLPIIYPATDFQGRISSVPEVLEAAGG